MVVGLLRFLQGPNAGLTGGREFHCGLYIVPLMLKLPKVDGDLQLVPLTSQVEVLRLVESINRRELSSKAAQRNHRLLQELVAYDTASARKLQCTAKSVLRAKGCCGSSSWPACPQQGARGRRLLRHVAGFGKGAR